MFKVYYLAILSLIAKEAVCLKKDIKPKEKPQSCEENTSQLISLFNIMCTNIANEDESTLADACVGCFTLASRGNNNQPSLSRLQECAGLYMTDTRYDDCVGIIEVSGTSSATDCVSGYCAFVRCIRRVNSDLLVNTFYLVNVPTTELILLASFNSPGGRYRKKIARCYSEASADNPADLEEEQIILYKNITSCILAISRCSQINPITGQSQTNTITSTTYGKLGLPMTTTVPLYNTLQINEAGDLRIVTFPGTTAIQKYLCPFEFNLRETSWMDFMC